MCIINPFLSLINQICVAGLHKAINSALLILIKLIIIRSLLLGYNIEMSLIKSVLLIYLRLHFDFDAFDNLVAIRSLCLDSTLILDFVEGL